MATAEWDVAFLLTSPQGSLPLNENAAAGSFGEHYYFLDKTKCQAGPNLRVSADDVPQGDGSILHRSFKSGYVVRLGIELWETIDKPACGELLREMWDELTLHLNALVRPAQAELDTGGARLQWTPTSYSDDRMWDRIELLEWPVLTFEGAIPQVSVAFHTPLPYALDETQQTDTLDVTVFNPGTAAYFPVFKVYGPADVFTITNATTGLNILYDNGLPGAASIAGGDYVEIATFTDTVYLNGNSTNLKPGIDVPFSDFFPLEPGNNVLQFVPFGGSPTCDVLWNPAWA